MEKSVALMTKCLKGSLASMAFSLKLIMEVELLKGILTIGRLLNGK